MAMKAVVLVSGGLDSATVLGIARQEKRECYALSFRYGQRHNIELEAAERVAKSLGAVEHLIMDLPLDKWGGSALTGPIDVPKDRDEQKMSGEIPVTYVPARNTVFLSLALAWAEVLEAHEIWIGVNALDYSGYPDCRPEFIQAFEKMARLATKLGVQGEELSIITPLIHHTKAQIIQKGTALGVDFSLTHSCYDPTPDGLACGHCDSCILRRNGFEKAGIPDPTRYA
ncbi:MAG: 7-cyano-7-deazaguanine synthase QueC [Candidatus Omnitrophica bacterium]|nr:7-cyano-7-deazaguanine synthase QueC [Candidatus Omnitrophota bacterium]